MDIFRNARDNATKPGGQFHWVRLAVAIVLIVALSLGLSFLFQRLIARFDLQKYDFAHLAYAIVFATALISNLTIIAPVPFAVSIMIAAAAKWNPALIALAASIGGALGELSGYYAGYLGKRIALSDSMIGYRSIERWVRHYGFWAIFVLAFQPIIPFDIGGLVAGAVRMPMHQFLPALWAGNFPKYLILTYAGAGIINSIPFFSQAIVLWLS